MATKRKTPLAVIKLINHQQEMMRHVDEQIRVLRTVAPELQNAAYLRGTTPEYWMGIAKGINIGLERALHDANCYAGFQYQAATPLLNKEGLYPIYPLISLSHPEYQDWRVSYITRM